MSEHQLPEFEAAPRRGARGMTGGGLSPQAIAALLLIAALLAVLFLLLGGGDESGSDAQATSTAPRSTTLATLARAESSTGLATAGIGAAATGAAGAAAGSSGLSTAAAGAPTTLAGAATAILSPGMSGASSLSTPTAGASIPGSLTINGFAVVSGTESEGVRLRFGYGLDTLTIRWLDEGEQVKLLGGPEASDGYSWYRVQDGLGNVGWAVDDYLRPDSAPAGWNPPLASPPSAATSP